MKRVHILWVVIISVLTFSCGKSIIGGDQDLSPEYNFAVQEFNDFYALFETECRLGRDLQVAPYHASIYSTERDLCSQLEYLNDRHVGLVTPFGGFVSGRSDEPLTFDRA